MIAPGILPLARKLGEKLEWRTDAPPFEERPSRQYVWISGERSHSGVRWRRDWWGLAFIRREDQPDCRLGYREEDIARLEDEGDMERGSAEIYGWLPAAPPVLLDGRTVAAGER